MKWSDSFEDLLVSQARFQKVFWGAMTVAIAVHIGLAYLLTKVVPLQISPMPEVVSQILFGMAFVQAAASMLVRRYRLGPGRLGKILVEPVEIERLCTNPKSGLFDESLRTKVMGMPEREQRLFGLLVDLSRTNILCVAINEAVVMMGLLAAIFAQKFAAVLPFAILGVCLNLLMFPRPREMAVEWSQHQERAETGKVPR